MIQKLKFIDIVSYIRKQMKAIVLFTLLAAVYCANEVTVDLYYETLCPGCE